MIPENETINCRMRRADDCKHGTPTAESSMDPEGDGMQEDGTWDGKSVICDVCYIAMGMPTFNPNPGLVGGGRGTPGLSLKATPITFHEAREAMTIGENRVHTMRLGSGAGIGADWDLEEARETMLHFHVAALEKPALGHGLLVIDGTGPIVFDTPDERYEVKQVNAGGSPLKEFRCLCPAQISDDLASDYTPIVKQFCEDADRQPGEWLEIIMGPPMLAESVDRLRIRRLP